MIEVLNFVIWSTICFTIGLVSGVILNWYTTKRLFIKHGKEKTWNFVIGNLGKGDTEENAT